MGRKGDLMKKIISVFLCIVVFVFGTHVFAETETQYADKLFELGLFKGTDEGYALGKSLTREESVTLLVRLLGEEKNIADREYLQVFSDVEEDRWSYPYVMYCYENDITKGTGTDIFSPADVIPAEQFVTLVLRLLGYSDVEPETALFEAVSLKLINSEKSGKLGKSDVFLREDAVYIVYRALMTENSEGEILAYVLADKGVITNNEAKEFDIYESAESVDELLDKLLG